ncbi:MAG: signal peptidase II [Verrucomicrobia bacterium]|nr:signal peptidase II [Verrucomicrobiota bacterium]
MKGFLKLLVIALPILCLDYVSKGLASFFLHPMQYSPVFPYGGVAVFHNFLGIDFCLNYVANHGIAWGLFGEMPFLIVTLRILIVASLIGYMIFSPKSRSYLVPLTLIITGAIGNIIDFFLYGHVVDIFHFIFWGYSYPVFNIADASIFVGICSILLMPYFNKRTYAPSES